ncbi:deaminase [Leucobacter muris]|uniref:Deaminase n=1 Tax=Leucobacter muris TaxID=1935379 RepID=A0ABX5QHF5_9MICO|nr:dihydrofolate reductase family protein [Leucobacter muris]QAB18384.1 deaminase [Leucobacter muris]
MGALIYSMIVTADGYVADAHGAFDWGVASEELHEFVAESTRSVGTYLYGRRMYDTMVYWETAGLDEELPAGIADYARLWRSCDKIVFSTSLHEPRSARTTLRRSFDPDEIRELKLNLDHDLTIDGPMLAAQALRAGLVDEIGLFVTPVVVGGGKRFFPEGVRCELRLLEQRGFDNGTVYLRYRVAD